MDALRVLLLSLMVGQNVSVNANFAEADFVKMPPAIVAENPAPTSPVIWDASVQVTPPAAETALPTRRPSGLPRNLHLGMKGDDVRRIQQLLSDLGYDVAAGGTFSAKTEEAVMYFQHVNGLSVDGVVGTKTYRKLTSSSALGPAGATIRTVLSYGMSGQDVMELQMRLGQLGYYNDVISGNYLNNTRKAVYSFQWAHGLSVDGIAGPETLYLVFSSMAMPAPGMGGNQPYPTKPWQPAPTSPWQPTPTNPNPGQTMTPPPSYTRTLTVGSSGQDVLRLTQRLRALGYHPYEPTSYFSDTVRICVSMFQKYNNLTPDGIASLETQKQLYSESAIPFSSATKPTATPTEGPTASLSPSPSPTAAPTDVPPVCAGCDQLIPPGLEHIHAPTLAECDIEGHYPCDGLTHEKQPCGLHFVCEPDALTHELCTVSECWLPLCDGHTHPEAK